MSEERRDTVFGTTVDNWLAEGGTKVDLTGPTEDNKQIFEKTLADL